MMKSTFRLLIPVLTILVLSSCTLFSGGEGHDEPVSVQAVSSEVSERPAQAGSSFENTAEPEDTDSVLTDKAEQKSQETEEPSPDPEIPSEQPEITPLGNDSEEGTEAVAEPVRVRLLNIDLQSGNFTSWEDYHQAVLTFHEKLEELQEDGILKDVDYAVSNSMTGNMFTSLHVENPSVPGDYENLANQGMVLGVSSGEVKMPGREAVRLIEGTAFAQVDLDDGRQVAVVPSTLWNQEYHVGDSLYIDSYVFLSSGNVDQQISTPFLVIGVYENEGNGAVFIPMQTFEKLTEKSLSFFAENGYDYFGQGAHPSYRWNQYFQEEVELASEADVPELKEALSQWNCEFEVFE